MEDVRAEWRRSPAAEAIVEDPAVIVEVEHRRPADAPGLRAWLREGSAVVDVDGDRAVLDAQDVVGLLPVVLSMGPRPRSQDDGDGDSGETVEPLRHWRVTARWGDDDTSRSIEVLDAPGHGIWRVVSEDTGSVALPTTTAAVWRALTTLLPSDDEL